MKQYRKRDNTEVVAVQFDFDSDGFEYFKWGAKQLCKPGDWIVNNDGHTYTVDADSFCTTYRQIAPGKYLKIAPVWAYVAKATGAISTKEGSTGYNAGDYIVCNQKNGDDCYAVTADLFKKMYEEIE